MNIEFKIFKLKKDSKTYKRWSQHKFTQNEVNKDMIIIGEEKIGDMNCIKVCTFDDNGLCLVNGLMLDDQGYLVPIEDIEYTNEIVELNIPNKYLSMVILENIQRINEEILG